MVRDLVSERKKISTKIWGSKSRRRFMAGVRMRTSVAKSTAIDISKAYLSEKKKFTRKIMVMDQEDSIDEKVSATVDFRPWTYGIYVNGQFLVVSRGIVVNSESQYYLPIVDNHGNLLGEFSKLDDLSLFDLESCS